jgi:hypothetical protein
VATRHSIPIASTLELMMRFLTVLVLCPCLPLPSWSQTTTFPPPQPPLSQVQQFLGLTDAQVKAILQNNADYNAFSFQQQRQIQNAQAQIALETAKDPLDPMALGTLYAGIESACRDLRNKASSSQQQNISLLTDAQKARLSLLNDAMKLAPTISEAQSGNLLGSSNSPPYLFSANSSGTFSSLIGFPSVPGCTPPLVGFTGYFFGAASTEASVFRRSASTRIESAWTW